MINGYWVVVRSRGFFSLVAPTGPRLWDTKIRAKGPGRLSLFVGYASALGLLQSLALNLPLDFDFPVGARKKSGFKGQRPRGTSKVGASKVRGNSSLGVKEGREREMIRPLSWNRALWKTSPSLVRCLVSVLPSACALLPRPLCSALPTRVCSSAQSPPFRASAC